MPTTKKHVYPEMLWAGTDHSLEIAREAYAAIMAGMFDGRANKQEDEEEVPYLFKAQGDIGVITIKGSLVNRESWYNRYAGVTAYGDIRRAMVYAAKQPDIKAILLDIASGGGEVAGVSDAGSLISLVSQRVKPVYTFADGNMASAAYWLGCSVGPGRVFVSSTSISGSIGVICTHMEYSKALREAGIGVKVLRAGEFKALASSMESLTPAAEKQIQDQLNAAYAVFAGHAADMRGTSMEVFEATMGQGREFFGVAAVTAGIADGVQSYDGIVSMINAKLIDISVNSANTTHQHLRGPQMTKAALSEQQVAALAAGGTVDAAALAAAQTAALAAADAAKIVADKAAADKLAADAATAAATKPDAVTAYLQGQIAESATKLTAAAVELATTKAQLTAAQASLTGLVAIAAQSISNMKVAMGGSKPDLSALTPEALLAAHASAQADFVKFIPSGQVSAAKPADPAAKVNDAADDADYSARVAATRIK